MTMKCKRKQVKITEEGRNIIDFDLYYDTSKVVDSMCF
jgi:hypothetical protein